MPEPLNFLYERLSYHKILPFVCNLSMKFSLLNPILVQNVPQTIELDFLFIAHSLDHPITPSSSDFAPVR